MKIIETARLIIRQLRADDAPFILRLLNEPSWLRFIGDKGVRTLDDARRYILEGPVQMYARHGFGLWLIELKGEAVPIGLCGLLKRDSLPDVDIGFALLPTYWCQGYAFESASAVISHGREAMGLGRILAITSPDNDRSGRLLEKLGFRFERLILLPDSSSEVKLYATVPELPGAVQA
ncbi:MAG TPA: GNAT family N-acetyltransferase [Blastocatellia bacterium]|nr:GNAT family N-acetyltransferase [Blastocatellia bacterium]